MPGKESDISRMGRIGKAGGRGARALPSRSHFLDEPRPQSSDSRKQAQGRPAREAVREIHRSVGRDAYIPVSRAQGVRAFLARLFGFNRPESRGDRLYHEAMRQSADLVRHMRDCSMSTDAARAIMADVWAQNHNIPFLTTVFEAVQEAKTGPETFRENQ